jgi:hypothetical protein
MKEKIATIESFLRPLDRTLLGCRIGKCAKMNFFCWGNQIALAPFPSIVAYRIQSTRTHLLNKQPGKINFEWKPCYAFFHILTRHIYIL